jgi:protein required for attachment to host cells
MQYPHGTTIAVTDGQKLRVFRNTGNEQHLRLLELPQPDIHAHSQGATRQHHSGAANPSERHMTEDSYALAAAGWLNAQVLSGDIEQLYIVAPPRTLGELRRHYHQKLQDKLLGELGKEHTHDTPEFLHEALTRA